MNGFILVLATSFWSYQPVSYHYQYFNDKAACEAVLKIALTKWETINNRSKCIDQALESEIEKQQEILNNLKGKR